MSEESQNLPSNDAAQGTGTGSEEAKSVPADAPVSGEEGKSTEGVHPEGGQSQAGNAETEEIFHEEGGKVFKTKDEYIRHVNKQRGAASRLAFERTRLERELQEKNQLLEKMLAGGKGPQAEQKQEEPEMDEETKQVLAELKRRGKFVSADEIEEMLASKLKTYESIVKKVQEDEQRQAQVYVDNFLEVNPDALEHYEAIVTKMTNLQKAGEDCSIEQAYFLVTGKAALASEKVEKPQESSKAPVSPTKAAKQAQAGAGSSNASSAAGGVKRDFFDQLLTS